MTAVGVVVLVADAGPTWLGVGLIVAGAGLTRLFARNVAAFRREQGDRRPSSAA
jgi:hypothetical protein